MFLKEIPYRAGGVDILGSVTDDDLWQGSAPGPRVPAALNGVKDDIHIS